MTIRGLLAKHNAAKPRVYRVRVCAWPCSWHAEHQDGSVSHCSDFSTALAAALNYKSAETLSEQEFARDADRANLPRRAWCHARHICHHWFEDECSDACDRGEHTGGHGHPGCADRSTPDSRSE